MIEKNEVAWTQDSIVLLYQKQPSFFLFPRRQFCISFLQKFHTLITSSSYKSKNSNLFFRWFLAIALFTVNK